MPHVCTALGAHATRQHRERPARPAESHPPTHRSRAHIQLFRLALLVMSPVDDRTPAHSLNVCLPDTASMSASPTFSWSVGSSTTAAFACPSTFSSSASAASPPLIL